jgi:hypothetical protein
MVSLANFTGSDFMVMVVSNLLSDHEAILSLMSCAVGKISRADYFSAVRDA